MDWPQSWNQMMIFSATVQVSKMSHSPWYQFRTYPYCIGKRAGNICISCNSFVVDKHPHLDTAVDCQGRNHDIASAVQIQETAQWWAIVLKAEAVSCVLARRPAGCEREVRALVWCEAGIQLTVDAQCQERAIHLVRSRGGGAFVNCRLCICMYQLG